MAGLGLSKEVTDLILFALEALEKFILPILGGLPQILGQGVVDILQGLLGEGEAGK